MTKLYAAPDLPPPRSLIEQVGSECPEAIDEYLQRRFGGQILSVVANTMVVFEFSDDDTEVRQLDARSCVASAYGGLEQVTVVPTHQRRLHIVRQPTHATIATFATSQSDTIPAARRRRMEDNDLGKAALYPKIGVLLTTPVEFEPLVDRSYSTLDELLPPSLHVVQ